MWIFLLIKRRVSYLKWTNWESLTCLWDQKGHWEEGGAGEDGRERQAWTGAPGGEGNCHGRRGAGAARTPGASSEVEFFSGLGSSLS